jgi:hypothetical protein
LGFGCPKRDARRGFREYTGFAWEPERRYKEVGNEQYSEFYEQCDIFEMGKLENEDGVLYQERWRELGKRGKRKD